MTKLSNSQLVELSNKGILTKNVSPVTDANVNGIFATPLTYIQKEAVDVLVAPMLFDEFVGGIEKNGSWGQDTVSIKVREYAGNVQSYVAGNSAMSGGKGADVQINSVVRGAYYYENSWKCDDKEAASAGNFNENMLQNKAKASMLAIALERNEVMFTGKSEKEATGIKAPVYGLLNEPGVTQIRAIPTVDAGVSTNTEWSTKTPDEIYNDIVGMVTDLLTQSKGLSMQFFGAGNSYRLGIANSSFGYLDRTNSYGLSARAKLKEAYGDKLKLFAIPQMDAYASGDNIMMIMIDANDGVKTVKGSYMELARAFQIDRLGSTTSQKIASAISGAIMQRPNLVITKKGI